MFNIFDWLKQKLGSKPIPISGDIFAELDEIVADVCFRELAFETCISLIANAVSKCEFKTFYQGKEVKEMEYYLWNVEPNKNQNASTFLHKLIRQLYRKGECLVIEQNGGLLVADDYIKTPYVLYEDTFTQVTVGDFTFNKTFYGSDVLYFQLSAEKITLILKAIYESYSKLMSHSMKAHLRSRGIKGIFEYGTIPPADSDDYKVFQDLVNNKFKKFMESASAILPLGDGQKFNEAGIRTYAYETTRDIKAMIDDIMEFTAKGFGIPSALIKGNIEGKNDAIDEFLTFCIDPLANMLSKEINRKRNGYNQFRNGTYTKIDTRTIKHIDLLAISTSIDKLVSSGVFSVNDILKIIGSVEIDEDWANKHFITKNYTDIENMNALEGGEGK